MMDNLLTTLQNLFKKQDGLGAVSGDALNVDISPSSSSANWNNSIFTAGAHLGQFFSPKDPNRSGSANKLDKTNDLVQGALTTMAQSGNPYLMGVSFVGGLVNNFGGKGKAWNAGKNFKMDHRIFSSFGGFGTMGAEEGIDQQAKSNKGFLTKLITPGFRKDIRNTKKQLSSIKEKERQGLNVIQHNQKRKDDVLSSLPSLNQQINPINYDGLLYGKEGLKVVQIKPYVFAFTKEIKKELKQEAKHKVKNLRRLFGDEIETLQRIKKLRNKQKDEILLKKEGGTIPKNVIVEGVLHSRKNNMEDVLELDLTKKGVPVVLEEGGNVTKQIQEVEGGEIIFHLQLTEKMEKLQKNGDEEQMLEAGKILAKEIVKNTKDNKSKMLKDE